MTYMQILKDLPVWGPVEITPEGQKRLVPPVKTNAPETWKTLADLGWRKNGRGLNMGDAWNNQTELSVNFKLRDELVVFDFDKVLDENNAMLPHMEQEWLRFAELQAPMFYSVSRTGLHVMVRMNPEHTPWSNVRKRGAGYRMNPDPWGRSDIFLTGGKGRFVWFTGWWHSNKNKDIPLLEEEETQDIFTTLLKPDSKEDENQGSLWATDGFQSTAPSKPRTAHVKGQPASQSLHNWALNRLETMQLPGVGSRNDELMRATGELAPLGVGPHLFYSALVQPLIGRGEPNNLFTQGEADSIMRKYRAWFVQHQQPFYRTDGVPDGKP